MSGEAQREGLGCMRWDELHATGWAGHAMSGNPSESSSALKYPAGTRLRSVTAHCLPLTAHHYYSCSLLAASCSTLNS